MKFKVGQMVKAKGDAYFSKGELLEIIKVDPSDETYRCESNGRKYWQLEDDLEPLTSSPQTLEDKLKLFKAGTHVLYTPTREIYDKLMVELEKRGYVWCDGKELPTKYNGYSSKPYVTKFFVCERNGYSSKPYVTKFFVCERNGIARQSKAYDKEVLTLTPEDFNENKQEVHMKITIETDGHHKTTAECRGITAESLCSPTDEFKLSKGVHMAVQRLLEKLDEDTGFHVGDIVKVLGTGTPFLIESVGLQGKIVKYDKSDNTYLVEFPVSFAGDNKWWYFPDALKLIHRGNN